MRARRRAGHARGVESRSNARDRARHRHRRRGASASVAVNAPIRRARRHLPRRTRCCSSLPRRCKTSDPTSRHSSRYFSAAVRWRVDRRGARGIRRSGFGAQKVAANRGSTDRIACRLPSDDDCLEALLALPPPIPAKDESLAVALLTYGLVHQWTSSRAALVASLGRRRARGVALLAAVEAGRRPTRAELSAWTHGDGAVQLAFPELVTADAPSRRRRAE